MLRSVGAVAAGFIVMAIIVMIGTMALVSMLVPGGLAAMRSGSASAAPRPTAGYLAANIILSAIAALVGGWITIRIADHGPVGHVEALCGVILVMGLISAFSPGAKGQPRWYTLLIPLIGVAGASASVLLANGGL